MALKGTIFFLLLLLLFMWDAYIRMFLVSLSHIFDRRVNISS